MVSFRAFRFTFVFYGVPPLDATTINSLFLI
ncbi:Potassium/proton antiporter, partial [Pseudomonas syringae pv. spinaceae]